jgi:hypothetical protein
LGKPFEGSEGGESPEREDESLKELRNRLRRKYPEVEPRNQDESSTAELHDRSDAKGQGNGRLDVHESSDEIGPEKELEVLRKEMMEKYPSTGGDPPKRRADPKIEKDWDSLNRNSVRKSDPSRQHLQDPNVDSRDHDREHEEKKSGVGKSRIEPDLSHGHEIERGTAPEAREHRPRTDNATERVEARASVARELVHDSPESHAKLARRSPAPEEGGGDSKVREANDARERRVIESTLQGERRGRPNFAIRKDDFEAAVGEKMEKGKEYEIFPV